MEPTAPEKDAIPRVTVDQLFAVLRFLGSRERSTFEEVRALLQRESARSAPSSPEAMWTSARDALSELQRLRLGKTGPVPRKRSEVEKLRGTPCELTELGRDLAARHAAKSGEGFDALLVQWVNEHPYFRGFLSRLAAGPLFVPDVTSVKQIGDYDGAEAATVASRLFDSCAERLREAGWTPSQLAVLEREVGARTGIALSRVDTGSLRGNAKAWIDVAQDSVVLPAFLAAERLPFDPVTFQHIIRVAQQFLAAAWTSSHPTFSGRVVFATCDFVPGLDGRPTSERCQVVDVSHRGKSWASERFEDSLERAYARVAGGRHGAYVDVYQLRALVCLDLGVQPKVFELCLAEIARTPRPGRPAIYTELPMRPPRAGEAYVQLGGNRIGLLKLVR